MHSGGRTGITKSMSLSTKSLVGVKSENPRINVIKISSAKLRDEIRP